MFPKTFFPKSYFSGAYFPPSEEPVVPPLPTSTTPGGGYRRGLAAPPMPIELDDEELMFWIL